MYTRLLTAPKQKSFFLFGPRGTGKTTWVRSQFSNSIYIDLLEGETFNRLSAEPSRISALIPRSFTEWIIIDEIQRVPSLLNEVHRLIETKKLKFIMTGSSARKLRRGGENLLAGRALNYFMHPLTAVELGVDFNLERALTFGTLPSISEEDDKARYLASYITTYLSQEIVQEGVSRNLGAFARFLETASFSQGSVLNVSEVGREAAVNRKVVEDYFSALEDMLLGFRLPVFSKAAKRRMITHRKFYFFDVGVYRAVRPRGPLDAPEMIESIALESLFIQNIRALNDYLSRGYTLFYYRTASGVEVDCIAYGENGLLAFEIKRKRSISSGDLHALRSFKTDYPLAKCYVIYGGNMRQHIDDIEIIPFEEALLSLPDLI